MENRSLSLAACLIALCAVAGPAPAADSGPSPAQEADWQQRLEKAAALQNEGKLRKAEAGRILEQKSAECFKKFLVNRCQDAARNEHMMVSREASNLEIQGKALEREVKKEQLADKDRRHAEAMPQRAADLAERAAETGVARQEAEAEAAASRADKARQAEQGTRRKAAEAEKQRKKQQDHEARVAQKVQQAERRAGEADAAKK